VKRNLQEKRENKRVWSVEAGGFLNLREGSTPETGYKVAGKILLTKKGDTIWGEGASGAERPM